MDQERIRGLEAWLAAYGDHDREAMRTSLSPDAVWHVGGNHQFSGDYRGPDAILRYFDTVREETTDSMRLERLELLADATYGAAFLRVTASRGPRRLDTVVADAFRFAEDGRIAEFWASSTDQPAVDEFWS